MAGQDNAAMTRQGRKNCKLGKTMQGQDGIDMTMPKQAVLHRAMCAAQVQKNTGKLCTLQYMTEQDSKVRFSTVQQSTAKHKESRVHSKPFQFSSVQYSTVMYSPVQSNPVQSGLVQSSSVQSSPVQYM